jgi:hypothetical protein
MELPYEKHLSLRGGSLISVFISYERRLRGKVV